MANTLRFKRGLASGIPTALAGEPLFTTDTFDLYIGNGTTNTRFQKYIASGATTQILRGDGSLYTFPLAISSPSNGQVLKYNGTSWVNDSDAGITGSGAAGQVAYFTGATTQAGNNNLFWDATNSRLGIGTNTPSAIFHARISASAELIFKNTSQDNLYLSGTNATINIDSTGGGIFPGIFLKIAGTSYGQFTSNTSSTEIISFQTTPIIFKNSSTERARIFPTTGNFGIGTGATDSGQKLQVVGTGYFSDSVGIGQTTLTGYNLRISNNITGIVSPIPVFVDGTIQATATGTTQVFRSSPSVVASATISEIRHFSALQGTFGGGSSVSTQTGFFVHSVMTGATTNFGFYGDIPSGTGRWNIYMNGTANNYMAGNLALGLTTVVATYKLSVYGTQGFFYDGIRLGAGYSAIDVATGVSGLYLSGSQGALDHLFINNVGRVLIGSTTDSGEKLQVTGTAKITGASSFGGDKTILAGSKIIFNNTLNNSSTSLQNTGATGDSILYSNGKISIGLTTIPSGSLLHVQGYMSIQNNLGYCGVSNTGGIVQILGLNSSNQTVIGTISSGSVMTLTGTNVGIGITPTEKLHVSGNAIVTGNLTVDTNTLFVDATNNRVGIGTAAPLVTNHVDGTFRVTSSYTTTVLGTDSNRNVLINSGATGTSAVATLVIGTGTAPTSSPSDLIQIYSADVTAGNAAPHFRTENGAVIKLYQETTGVGNSIFSQGGGNSVLDDSTFDGYTLRQIVKALRNQGILA